MWRHLTVVFTSHALLAGVVNILPCVFYSLQYNSWLIFVTIEFLELYIYFQTWILCVIFEYSHSGVSFDPRNRVFNRVKVLNSPEMHFVNGPIYRSHFIIKTVCFPLEPIKTPREQIGNMGTNHPVRANQDMWLHIQKSHLLACPGVWGNGKSQREIYIK